VRWEIHYYTSTYLMGLKLVRFDEERILQIYTDIVRLTGGSFYW
jgi:hypothetical protein